MRLVICELIDEGILFLGQNTYKVEVPHALDTALLSLMERCASRCCCRFRFRIPFIHPVVLSLGSLYPMAYPCCLACGFGELTHI